MENKSASNNFRIITMADDLKKVQRQTKLEGSNLAGVKPSDAPRIAKDNSDARMEKDKIVGGIVKTAPAPASASASALRPSPAPTSAPTSVPTISRITKPPAPKSPALKPLMPRPQMPSRPWQTVKKTSVAPTPKTLPEMKSEMKREIKPEIKREMRSEIIKTEVGKKAESEKEIDLKKREIEIIGEIPQKRFSEFLKNRKIAVIIAASVFFVVLMAGGLVFYKFGDILPKELIVVEEVKSPDILTIFADKILEVDRDVSSQSVLEGIKYFLNDQYPDKSFTRILIKSENLDLEQNTKYSLFSDFKTFIERDFGIRAPELLIDLVDSFDFAIYSSEGLNRLVIVAKIQDGAQGAAFASEEFIGWEKTMKSDLESFLAPMDIDANESDSLSFNDNQYRDADIRYVNFGGPRNSLDYAVIPVQNIFIITSSRDSMYAVLDDLL